MLCIIENECWVIDLRYRRGGPKNASLSWAHVLCCQILKRNMKNDEKNFYPFGPTMKLSVEVNNLAHASWILQLEKGLWKLRL